MLILPLERGGEQIRQTDREEGALDLGAKTAEAVLVKTLGIIRGTRPPIQIGRDALDQEQFGNVINRPGFQLVSRVDVTSSRNCSHLPCNSFCPGKRPVENRTGDGSHRTGINSHSPERLFQHPLGGEVDVHFALQVNDLPGEMTVAELDVALNVGQGAVGSSNAPCPPAQTWFNAS